MSREPRFRCTTCGDRFDLNKEELEEMEEGGYGPPHTCDECLQMLNHPPDMSYEAYSDADSGL